MSPGRSYRCRMRPAGDAVHVSAFTKQSAERILAVFTHRCAFNFVIIGFHFATAENCQLEKCALLRKHFVVV